MSYNPQLDESAYVCRTNKVFKCVHRNMHGDVVIQKYVCWRLFYPQCPKINFLCNPIAGAYVPAVTVCSQNLWG